MITLKKLASLKERTMWRKISIILHQQALLAKRGQEPDMAYVNAILSMAKLDQIKETTESLAFDLEDASQELLKRLGAEPSDWDFTEEDGALDSSKRVVYERILVLDRIRSPYNVGAIFRSADSFGIKKIFLVQGTASPDHPRALKTSRGCTSTVDWEFMSLEQTLELLDTAPQNIMALEVGGENLNTAVLPPTGVVILGSEEFGISPELLARTGRRLSIPMGGTKGSLNVAVAAGILLAKWFCN